MPKMESIKKKVTTVADRSPNSNLIVSAAASLELDSAAMGMTSNFRASFLDSFARMMVDVKLPA
jgi:hypothetical protein